MGQSSQHRPDDRREQHRRLVELINQLFQHLKDGGDCRLLGRIIAELVDYTVSHFRTEEYLLQQYM